MESVLNIDFDVSMGKSNHYYQSWYKDCVASKDLFSMVTHPRPATDLLDFFRMLYDRNVSNLIPSSAIKIPHITHMIWLGNKLPSVFKNLRQSWIQHHPSWTHILWVDNKINYNEGEFISDFNKFKTCPNEYVGKSIVIDINHSIKLYNEQFYHETKNLGERSDLLRWEVVYTFGGLYIDFDFECFKPLDFFHKHYDFYIGIQPLDVQVLAVGAALFGAIPEHPILEHCIKTIKNDRHLSKVFMRTGPVHLTKSFWLCADDPQYKNIAFPPTYFYPMGMDQRYLNRVQRINTMQPESFAIHHWAASWDGMNMMI